MSNEIYILSALRHKAYLKEIGDEGAVPYCIKCRRPIFDMFNTCILALAVNEYGEIALIHQDHVSQTKSVCVAGYIKDGETAEAAAFREVEEELGLTVENAAYLRSYYYERKDMLMLGFIVYVKKRDFYISSEVDSAGWYQVDEGMNQVRKGSIAWTLINDYRTGINDKM